MTDIRIGRNGSTSLDAHYGNRHGMIAGATGTGKSVSLMVLAEGFSQLGLQHRCHFRSGRSANLWRAG